MKLLKIGEDYYNTAQILRIVRVEEDYAKIYLAGKEHPISVSKETLEEIFEFVGKEETEIEQVTIPYLSIGG